MPARAGHRQGARRAAGRGAAPGLLPPIPERHASTASRSISAIRPTRSRACCARTGTTLDFYARRNGAAPAEAARAGALVDRGRGRRAPPTIAGVRGDDHAPHGLLYTIAQLPNGTRAQRRAFRGFQTLDRAVRAGDGAGEARRAGQLVDSSRATVRVPTAAHSPREMPVPRRSLPGERTGDCGPAPRREARSASYAFARWCSRAIPSDRRSKRSRRSSPTSGWARDTDKIVFAHTHQPLNGVTGRAVASATGTPARGSTSPT